MKTELDTIKDALSSYREYLNIQEFSPTEEVDKALDALSTIEADAQMKEIDMDEAVELFPQFQIYPNEGIEDVQLRIALVIARIRKERNKELFAHDDAIRRECASFEEIKEYLISKSSEYKSEYIQAAIVILREMFKERAAILGQGGLEMTREEAIEVVKSNWPPAHYTMLTEALNVLIAHDEAIRRECADRADHEVAGWLAGCQRRLLRAAILGTEPAREEL